MRMPTRNKILSILNDPPKTLDQRYDEALRRIGDSDDVLHMLGWLARARRDLTSKELLHALAIQEGTSDIDRDDILPLDSLIQNSAGLVYVENSGTVRLLHRTVKEYLNKSSVCTEIDLKICRACLTYLCYEKCVQPLNEHNKLADVERKYPLLKYAARFWGEHYKAIPEEDRAKVHPQMLDFANKSYRAADAYMGHWALRMSVQKALQIWKGDTYKQDRRSLHMMSGPRPRAKWSGAHYAIFFGSFSMLKFFADHGVDLHQNPDRSGALLTLAAGLDRIKAAEFLIQHGVDVNVEGWDGSFPLLTAVGSGSIRMVEILLDAGCNIHQKARGNRKTPLHQACFHDRADVVDLLWQRGANTDIESDDDKMATPLAYVMDKGRERCRELLLFKHKAFTPFSALGLAVPMEDANLLRRLLEQGNDPNQTFGLGQSALDVALRIGNPDLIKFCIERGAHPRLYWREDDPAITAHANNTESWSESLKHLLQHQRKPYHSVSRSDYLVCEDHRLEYLKVRIPDDNDNDNDKNWPTAPNRIMFTITSHDQGWSNYPETWGAYRGSQTFFVSRIYQPDEKRQLQPVPNGDPRPIVRNVHASSQPKMHTVVWDARDRKKGCAKWMAELRPGRVIHVNARAAGKGLGWENHVHAVRVDLFRD